MPETKKAELKVVEKPEEKIPDANAKDGFHKLTKEWKDGIEGLNTTQLKDKLAEVELLAANNEAALKADEDVANQREKLNYATEAYRKERAELKLKKKYLTRHLADKGNETAEKVIKNEKAAEALRS